MRTNQDAPLRVLVLEDDIGDRALLESGTPRGLIQFDFCGSLSEFKSEYRPDQHDAVLIDLTIPDSGGYLETALEVKAVCQCPVIALTGISDSEAARRAMITGIQGYLVKGRHSPLEMIDMLKMSLSVWQKSVHNLPVVVPEPAAECVREHAEDKQIGNRSGGDVAKDVGATVEFLYRRKSAIAAIAMAVTAAASWAHNLLNLDEEQRDCNAQLERCESRCKSK